MRGVPCQGHRGGRGGGKGGEGVPCPHLRGRKPFTGIHVLSRHTSFTFEAFIPDATKFRRRFRVVFLELESIGTRAFKIVKI